MGIRMIGEDPVQYFSWIAVVMFSICIHEFAHAYTALKCGDDTAARAGHLSLNPMVQMGGMSLLMLILIGIAWGAVPVDRDRMKFRYGDAITSFAGPLSNVLLAIVFGLCVVIVEMVLPAGTGERKIAEQLCELGAWANCTLFILNMLPAPPLDGWSVFAAFIPRMRRVSARVAQGITVAFILLIFVTPVGMILWGGGYLMKELIVLSWRGVFGGLT